MKANSIKKTKGRPDEIDGVVAQRIRTFRHLQGMSQTDVAQAIGVTYQQFQKYETGANRVSASTLLRIAQALGIDINLLISEEKGGKANGLINSLSGDKQLLELVREWQRIDNPELKKRFMIFLRSLSKG